MLLATEITSPSHRQTSVETDKVPCTQDATAHPRV